MLRSLHTVSSGARHAIQPHLLSIQFFCSSHTVSSGVRHAIQQYPMQWNAIQYTTIQCNAMQCNAMAQPNARKNAMLCSVPRIRCPRALAMPSSSIMQCNVVQYNTLQYNAMQCNAMQCNAMQWHSPTQKKTLCHAPFLAYGVLGRSPCHPPKLIQNDTKTKEK